MNTEAVYRGLSVGEVIELILVLAALGLAWSGLSFIALALGGLTPPDGSDLLVAAMTVGFILFAAQGSFVFLRRVEPCLTRCPRLRLILVLGCFGITAGLFFLVRQGGLAATPAFVFSSANLLILANLFGTWLVSALRRPAELVPVCAVMAAADLLSLWAGPTREVVRQLESYYRSGMKGPVPAGEFLLVQVAVPGLERLLPLFGVADWIMIVFLLAAMARFGLNDNLAGPPPDRRSAPTRWLVPYLPVSAVALALAVLLAQGLGIFLPALPVVGLFFIVYLLGRFPGARCLNRFDWCVLLLAAGLVAGGTALRFGLL